MPKGMLIEKGWYPTPDREKSFNPHKKQNVRAAYGEDEAILISAGKFYRSLAERGVRG
jgi:hypothetical protein